MPNTSRYLPYSAEDKLNYLTSPSPTTSASSRAASIQSAIQSTTPSATTVPAPKRPTYSSDFASSLKNIITGTSSAKKMATLVNPTTGARQAVTVGSQEAQQLFGQGFVLETASPATQKTTTTAATTTAAPSQISLLKSKATKTRADMFNAVYGYSTEEWETLDPEAQRRLRNLRVQGLAAELGNYNDAIKTVKEETKTAKEDALNTLNTYLEYGVLNDISEDELNSLASSTGMSVNALKSISTKSGTEELKEFNGNLYSVSYDESGKPVLNLVMAGKKSGGGGTSQFSKDAGSFQDQIISGKLDWGTAWDSLHTMYPDKSNTELDQALGGSIEYNPETKKFGQAKGLASKTSVISEDELKSKMWQYLASPEMVRKSDKEKIVEIQGAGLNPKDFNLVY